MAPTPLTTYPSVKRVDGPFKVARVAFTGAQTNDLVAIAAGKTVTVYGLLWTNASAAAIIVNAKDGDGATAILTTQAKTELQLNVQPHQGPHQFTPHLQCGPGEGLSATSAVNANVVVLYTQE